MVVSCAGRRTLLWIHLTLAGVLATGCVRVPVSRAQRPIPQAPVAIEKLNPIGAVATVVGGENSDPALSRALGDDPLPSGADLEEMPEMVRQVSRRESRDYLATSRGFESPPIDPLGQTPILDRPLYQR